MSVGTPRGAALLGEPAQRAARLIALDLLDDVRRARERLDNADDDEALHDFRVALRRLRSWLRAFRPWLDDTLKRKVERRLKRLAQATNDSRDLQVHMEWVRKERRSLSPSARTGATWLVARLRREKVAADLAFRAAVDADFDDDVEDTSEALVRFESSVFENPMFAEVIAGLVEQHAAECRDVLAPVPEKGDRAEVHAARIWAKRMRYLLEPLADDTPGTHAAIDELKALQDEFGELHDAQVFGSAIAGLMAEAMAARTRRSTRAAGTASRAAKGGLKRPSSPVPGLRVLSRRLHRSATECLASISKRWNDDGATALSDRVAAVGRDFRSTGTTKRSKVRAGS